MELNKEQKKMVDEMVEHILEVEVAEAVGQDTPTSDGKPNAVVNGILEWGKQLNFQDITPNTVLLVKVNVDDPEYAHAFQMGVVKHVLEPRFDLLKEKKVTVLFITDKDDLTVLSEKEMNEAGWEKKEKSLIIKPYSWHLGWIGYIRWWRS